MSVWSNIKNLWSEEEKAQPSTHPVSPSPATSEPQKPVTAKSEKILVVDDNPVIVKTLTFKLKSGGYQVCTAADGSEAVSAARKDKPDLILLDISFPPDLSFGGGVAWDGFSVMDWLRRGDESRKIPIIVITGGDPAKYEAQAKAAGAAAFFQKPIDHEELLKVIQQILKEKASPPADAPAASTDI